MPVNNTDPNKRETKKEKTAHHGMIMVIAMIITILLVIVGIYVFA